MRKTVLNIHPSIAAWDLGRGESEVLTLALGKPRTGVVLDDLQARKCAELFEISLIGTLGLVVLAKRKGLISAWPPLDCTLARPYLLVYWLGLVKQTKGIKKNLEVNLDNLQTAK